MSDRIVKRKPAPRLSDMPADTPIRPNDVGLTVDELRRIAPWATEYGPASDPYWLAGDILGEPL